MRKLHLLLDADGNMMNWGGRWDHIKETHYSEFSNIPLTKDQRSFDLKIGLTEAEKQAIDDMFDHEGFYRDLEPYEGAVEAYHKMVEAGHRVQFATSPWWTNKTCLQDKSDSILKHFGEDAQRSLILTSDKTILLADYLFDDKPQITGHYTPVWFQILYDQPYNQDSDLPRITHWDQWEDALQRLEDSYAEGEFFLASGVRL